MTTIPPNPYDPPQLLAPGLLVVKSVWGRSPLGRRMTVMSTGPGRCAIHSAVRVADADLAQIEAVGAPSLILVPNQRHWSEAGWYKERYPDAKLLVPRDVLDRLRTKGLAKIDGSLETFFVNTPQPDIAFLPIDGLRGPEAAFLHRPTRTLVLCDLCFNFKSEDLQGFARTFMRLNRGLDRFGPTRFLRWLFTENKDVVRRSVDRILQWDFDRVIVSHGRVLDGGGPAALRAGFEAF